MWKCHIGELITGKGKPQLSKKNMPPEILLINVEIFLSCMIMQVHNPLQQTSENLTVAFT
jgi:hypothetical protein